MPSRLISTACSEGYSLVVSTRCSPLGGSPGRTSGRHSGAATADALSGSRKAPDTAARLMLLRKKGRTGRRLRVLRTNANDRLPLASLRRVEGGDSIVEGRHVADVRPQSSVTNPPDDLTKLGTIGLDNEIDGQTVGGPRLDRADDGDQPSPGTNQTRR